MPIRATRPSPRVLVMGLCLLALALPAPAAGQTAARTSTPLDTFLDGVRRTVLANGLTLLVREQRGTGVVAIDTWVKAGYFNEPDEKAGMAHLFEHMFFKGSQRFPGAERISEELAAVGGDTNAGTIYDSTNYYFVVPTPGFPRAVEIMADAIAHPLFDATELAREAEVVIEESNQKLDNPTALSIERMLATSFTAHRIRRWRIGSNEVLRGIRRDDLLAFFETLYRPENLIVAVAGDIAAAEAEALVRDTFGAIPRGTLDKRSGPREPAQTEFRFGRSTGDLGQGWSVMGWHTQGVGGSDEEALDLLARILGQGRASRFFRHVIGPDAAATATAVHWQFDDVGSLIVQASFDETKRAEVERRLLAEVERLRAHGPTAAELAAAKNAIESGTILGLSSALGQVSALAQAEARGGYRTLGARLAALRAVTADQVREAARTYLTLDGLTVYHHAPADAPATDRTAVLAAARAAMSTPPPALADAPLPPAPAALPPAGADRPPQTVTLSNGATLVVRERPGAPTVSLGIYFTGGRQDESSANAGVTQLVTGSLRRGTASRDGEAINRELEALGTQFSTDVGADAFGLRLDVIARNVAPAVDLLADVVLNPAFPAAAVDEERALQVAAVRRANDSSVSRAMTLAYRDLFAGHPYGLPGAGTETSLSRLDSTQVRDWWKGHVNARGAVILVVGDVAADAVRALVEKAFAALPLTVTSGTAIGAPEPLAARTDAVEYRDRKQSAIAMLFPAPPPDHPDAARLALLEYVTSGGAGTLYAELRGRRSLAYAVFQGYRPRKQAGVLLAYLASEASKETEARDALLAELTRLSTDGFGEVELVRARAAYAGGILMGRETNGALLSELAENYVFGLPFDTADRHLATARATTLEELRDTARRYFAVDRFVTAIVRGKS